MYQWQDSVGSKGGNKKGGRVYVFQTPENVVGRSLKQLVLKNLVEEVIGGTKSLKIFQILCH